jgi:integrase
VRLEIADFDFAYRQIRVRAEHAKKGSERVVGYSSVASQFLETYLSERRALSAQRGPLFLPESRRNKASPLSLIMWSKMVEGLAHKAEVPQFTTHTPRHLRLTQMTRAHMDLHQIALYACHKSLQTTMRHVHLRGIELTEAVSRNLAGFEQWIAHILEGALT